MKKILLFIALMISHPAMAQWVDIGEGSDVTLYMDFSRITKDGGYISAWAMFDYNIPRKDVYGKTYNSSVVKSQYDCVRKQRMTTDIYFYSGRMGEGVVIWSNSDRDGFKSPPPNSLGEAQIDYACKKR